METMRYREKKKKYTIQIVALTLFLVLGIGFIIFAIFNEKEPIKLGNNLSNLDFQKTLDEESNALVDIYNNVKEETSNLDLEKLINIENRVILDKNNLKVKANIRVPVISINKSSLDSLNNSVYEKFNKSYIDYKEIMKDAKNTFTYNVDYEYYLNSINNIKILSVVIHEEMIDNKSKKHSKDNKYTYNINIDTRKIVKQEEITDEILGSNYKNIIKEAINKALIQNKVLSKDDIKYSYTELEHYYIKENKFHIIFNPLDINDRLNKIIDIEMEKE